MENKKQLVSKKSNPKKRKFNKQESIPDKNPNKKLKTDKDSTSTKNVKNIQYQKKKSKQKRLYVNDGNEVDEPKSCHQCHTRNDKRRVLECEKCRSKRFCTLCIAKWYPNVPEEEFVKACPVCCSNCNCRPCLRRFSPKDMEPYSCAEPDKIQYSKCILKNVFPLVKNLYEEQLLEKEIEVKVKGLSLSEFQLQDAEREVDDDIFCGYCGVYIFDLYRRCSCGYNLCLVCCRELRDGQIKLLACEWKARLDGSVSCPPKDTSGCDNGTLELKRIMPIDLVANMLAKAKGIYKKINDNGNELLQEKSSERCFYSVSAKDIQSQDMQRFQLHWSKGEPVIVNDVLSTSSGLSWEPMVLLRAFRDHSKKSDHSLSNEANAINCWDWSKVSVNLYKFFNGYSEGQFKKKGYPLILKLEDWQPSCLSRGELPRHFVELINCLPFKDYTHPYYGYLNVAVKLPELSLKPNMGPKMDIAYGVEEELEYGDSVTNLHYDKSDTVNVLTHTKSAGFSSELLLKVKMVKLKHGDQKCVVDPMEGSALWDIFHRQDIPKLEEYLRNHLVEFKHVDPLFVEEVIHPIHDGTFYLNTEHKRKLKEEFGIEPWTIKQKLGDAVFIPAGCPYQVKNIKSNTKVELNFVSPESLEECIRLQHELRMLPNNHTAKQQKLNIGKMMIYALDNSLADLDGIIDSNGSRNDLLFANGPEIVNNDDMINVNNTNGWVRDSLSDDDLHEPVTVIEDSLTLDETAGVWKGHNVGLDTKTLLLAIEHHYPETFQSVQIRSNAFWLSILKEFYSVIKGFLETSVNELEKEQMTSFQEDFNEIEKLGFDLSWAHKRLDIVKDFKFGNDPLKQELVVLDESLQSVQKELVEVQEKLKKVLLDFDNVTNARNKKVEELAQKFGDEYDRGQKGNLGSGILPGY